MPLHLTITRVDASDKPYRLPASQQGELPKVEGLTELNEGTTAKLPIWQIVLNQLRMMQHGYLSRYPSSQFRNALSHSLAEYADVAPDQVLLANGSDALLGTVSVAARNGRLPTQTQAPVNGATYMIVGPTYAQATELPALHGNQVFEVRGQGPKFEMSLEQLDDAIAERRPDVVYICNPNNPTGKNWPSAQLAHLVEKHPNTFFLIDEAYVEFGGQSVAQYTGALPNLLVSRTMSKAFGLASTRVGYALGKPETIADIAIFTNDKDVSDFDACTALTCLSNRGYLARHVKAVEKEMDKVVAILSRHGFEHFEGGGNFVAFYVPPERTAQFLEWGSFYGIKFRDLSRIAPGLLRISVGDKEVTEHFDDMFPRIETRTPISQCKWLDWPESADIYFGPSGDLRLASARRNRLLENTKRAAQAT